MVAYYTLFGQKVGSHYLAMGTLTALFGGIYAATSGKKAPVVNNTPPINASSSDEADFIKKFLENSESEAKKEKH